MSVNISINNFSPTNILESAQLNADAVSSASPVTLNLVNNNNIYANDYILIGDAGAENSELKQVTSVSGANSVVLPSLSFTHNRFSNVTKLFGDKITVYRASNVDGTQPPDSAFAVFNNSQISIDIDQPQTTFTDPTGSSDNWYKYVYTNSTTASSTALADSSAARGQGYGNYCSLDDIRAEAGFTRARYITDAMIETKRRAAQEMVNSTLVGNYALPFTTPINPLIADITTRLAAGWLLLEQYGPNATGTQDGQKKVDSVYNKDKSGDLDKLQLGTLILTDANGSSMETGTGATGFTGWPNSDTAQADPQTGGGGDFLFKIGGLAGYHERDY